MTHTHQSKRQYAGSQPHITSFFSSAPSPSSTSAPALTPYSGSSASIIPANGSPYSISTYSAVEDGTRSPQLPAAVQSSLLSVGMRVRKSVPEGYKTGSEYSAFQLFSNNTTPRTTSSFNRSDIAEMQKPQEQVKTRPRAGVRELMPFCGLLDVGGLAQRSSQQQWGVYSSASATDEDDMDEVPFLSSQGSTISSSSFEGLCTEVDARRGSKRRVDFDSEEEEERTGKGWDFGKSWSGSIGTPLGDRAIAVPRRKRYQGQVQGKTTGSPRGQENRVFGSEDFGEADFLDYDPAREVEMGGV